MLYMSKLDIKIGKVVTIVLLITALCLMIFQPMGNRGPCGDISWQTTAALYCLWFAIFIGIVSWTMDHLQSHEPISKRWDGS